MSAKMGGETETLYARLGGYDAISAVCDDLLARMNADPQLAVSGRTAERMACGAKSN